MRNTFKATKIKGIFIAFQRLKTSIIIHCTIVVSLTHFLHFTKYSYLIFVMKDCIICTKDDKRERNLFFAKLLADMTLRALKNALDGIFQTLRRAKQRSERRNRKEEIKVTSKHFNGLG